MEGQEEAVHPNQLVIFASLSGDGNQLSDSHSEMHSIDQLKNDLSQAVVGDGVELMSITKMMSSQSGVKKEVELYLCEKCNRTFKQKSRYERHVTNHPSEKHYLCNICQKTFTRMSHLEKHTRTHTEERRHICDTCGAAFILPHHLVRHALVHTGVKPFECEICHKQFTRKAGLSQHKYVHTGVRPYACESCGKQFTDRTTLRRHMLTHSREKPFICKECEKTFRTKSACRKHYLRHFKGEASFKCGICEEMFKSQSMLNEHNLMHEQKQKNGNYRCGFCLRVFKTQTDLNAHVPLHERGLRNCCKQCPAKFYTEKDLAAHTEGHVGALLSSSNTVCDEKMDVSIEKNNYIDKDIPRTSLANQTNSTDNNKVVVVLQVPSSVGDSKGEEGGLQIDNIQQILGSAQIDKLLVTTEKVTDASSGLSLELSQDQQECIQQILQTTNVTSAECRKQSETCVNATSAVHMTVDEVPVVSSVHDNVSVTSKNQYMLTSITNSLNDEKPPYIIVPYKDGNQEHRLSSSFANEGSATLAKRGGDSVFKSTNQTAFSSSNVNLPVVSVASQPIMVVNGEGVPACEKATQQTISDEKVLSLVHDLESHGSEFLPDFGVESNSVSTSNSAIADRPLQDLQIAEVHGPTKPAFFSGEFENPLSAGNILSGEETAFTIATSN